jgi:hypothetical protein
MTKYSSILFLALFSLWACKKSDDGTRTKVGFYSMDSTAVESSLSLFVDNEFKGKLPIRKNEPTCGDSTLLFIVLDGKKHQLDVKNDNGDFKNSEYIEITATKCGAGSGKNHKHVDGRNGSTLSRMTDADCATMGFTR